MIQVENKLTSEKNYLKYFLFKASTKKCARSYKCDK